MDDSKTIREAADYSRRRGGVPEPPDASAQLAPSAALGNGVFAYAALPLAAFSRRYAQLVTEWPLLARLSYPRVIARVTSRTKLTELKAKVASTDRHGKDGPARLVRSVQQSLRVEGYDVREEVLRSALRRATAGRAR